MRNYTDEEAWANVKLAELLKGATAETLHLTDVLSQEVFERSTAALCGSEGLVVGLKPFQSHMLVSSYGWEMLWEMTVIGSVFPLYDGLNAFVLLTWWHTGNLNYVEHHVMNAVWTMSKTCAAVLLFSAHDAHWFWPHPGLGLFQRWAVQLVPQLLILLPYLLRIFKHVAAAPTSTIRPKSLNRKAFGLTRAATLPASSAQAADFEVPFANELASDDEELFAPEEAEAPTSPITAAITRQRVSLDSVAVVRSVPLSRPASASEVRQDEFQAHIRRWTCRSGTKDLAEKVEVQLRPLSREESLRRSASAVSFFKASQAINRRSFSNEALGNALAAARQRRSAQAHVQQQLQALEAPEASQKPEASPPKPRRRSFAEQFGYGVILKTQPPASHAQDMSAPVKPRISSGFSGLQAGDTDLLQRLARRRAASGG
eukprot:g30030.t1